MIQKVYYGTAASSTARHHKSCFFVFGFIETFISCRGNIKEVEKELKISYPTVRSRLDEVIEKLGCKPAPVSGNKKKEILDALERGEITPEEALEQMK